MGLINNDSFLLDNIETFANPEDQILHFNDKSNDSNTNEEKINDLI